MATSVALKVARASSSGGHPAFSCLFDELQTIDLGGGRRPLVLELGHRSQFWGSQVRLAVPAKIKLRVRPTHSRWGGTIHISGRVLGGYLPRGKLLRLRIGAEGVSGTVGIPDVGRKGRFRTTWTFAQGSGRVRYWFAVSTLPEADYPYAPASSPRRTETVGP